MISDRRRLKGRFPGQRNLVLVGFMGVGKSTIGKLCALRLGWEFVDSDQVMESRFGCSVAELFAVRGEAAFRQIEQGVIRDLCGGSRQVISTGGGAVLDAGNVDSLRKSGWIVWLQASAGAILSRVGNGRTRPLLADHADPLVRIEALLKDRGESYARAADSRIDTDESVPEAIVDKIMEELVKMTSPVSPARSVRVGLDERSYDIHIDSGMIATGKASSLIAVTPNVTRICIVTHPGVLAKYAQVVQAGLRMAGREVTLFTIPAGERVKNLNTVARLYRQFVAAGLDRRSLVVALGGGVLGDLVGFAAATYLRGIRFVQVPTTLLAQVDASVGGKTGVDLVEGKNLVGAFHQPIGVFIDPQTLRTLSPRELRSGLAEVIKYGIIYDNHFFDDVERSLPLLLLRSESELISVIARSCEIKAEVVGLDETEQGLRAILNFGHTIGHAVEAITHYRRYKHGEAIAIGMVAAALIGEEMKVTPPAVTERIKEVLSKAGLPVQFPADLSIDDVLVAAGQDKKTYAGKLHFVLARRLGEVLVSGDVPDKAIRTALARQI